MFLQPCSPSSHFARSIGKIGTEPNHVYLKKVRGREVLRTVYEVHTFIALLGNNKEIGEFEGQNANAKRKPAKPRGKGL
jgi:hypothetical protein